MSKLENKNENYRFFLPIRTKIFLKNAKSTYSNLQHPNTTQLFYSNKRIYETTMLVNRQPCPFLKKVDSNLVNNYSWLSLSLDRVALAGVIPGVS